MFCCVLFGLFWSCYFHLGFLIIDSQRSPKMYVIYSGSIAALRA